MSTYVAQVSVAPVCNQLADLLEAPVHASESLEEVKVMFERTAHLLAGITPGLAYTSYAGFVHSEPDQCAGIILDVALDSKKPKVPMITLVVLVAGRKIGGNPTKWTNMVGVCDPNHVTVALAERFEECETAGEALLVTAEIIKTLFVMDGTAGDGGVWRRVPLSRIADGELVEVGCDFSVGGSATSK